MPDCSHGLQARKQGQMSGRYARGESAAAAHSSTWPEQAEARDVGHGMHAASPDSSMPGRFQLCGRVDHGAIACVVQQAFLERCGEYADAQRLAEINTSPLRALAVALTLWDRPRRDGGSIDRLDRIDAVAAGMEYRARSHTVSPRAKISRIVCRDSV